jgi:hypothetical protein
MSVRSQAVSLSVAALLSFAGAPGGAQDDAATLQPRATLMEKSFPRALPQSLAEPRAWSWQSIAPRELRRSLKPAQPAELKLGARLSNADLGYLERQRPAVEQLALGLDRDPPRPEYPQLIAAPKASLVERNPYELVQFSPLSRSAEARPSLVGDEATQNTRRYTLAIVSAGRNAAPVTSYAIADPFEVRREATTPKLPPDADPPEVNLAIPDRPRLELDSEREKAKP